MRRCLTLLTNLTVMISCLRHIGHNVSSKAVASAATIDIVLLPRKHQRQGATAGSPSRVSDIESVRCSEVMMG